MKQKEFADTSDIRGYNQYSVLNRIYSLGVTSRTSLAKDLNTSKPAIADNLKRLIEIGLIKEVGEGKSTKQGGRRPRLLKFNADHKMIIAIDLNFSNPIFVLGNLNNEILCEFDVTVDAGASTEEYLSIIKNGIKILMSSRSLAPSDLVCIAISSPGMFNAEGNLCACNPSYTGIPWANIDVRPFLLSHFNIPVLVKNDIMAATLGEWESCENISEDMLFIGCGIGVGAGIVLNGELFEGKHYTAGQLFNYVDTQSLKKGSTIEDRVNLSHLLSTAKQGMLEGKTISLDMANGEELVFSDLVEAYKKKDPFVLGLVRQIGEELSVIALNTTSFLSIRNIVFGGEYVAFSDIILESFTAIFNEHADFKPTIRVSQLGRHAGIYGLFSQARQYYFQEVCKKKTVFVEPKINI